MTPLTELTAANPVPARVPGADTARLTTLRAVVDTRRATEPHRPVRRAPRRRLAIFAGLTAAAVATPLALAVAVPGLWHTVTGRPARTAPLIDAAIAADGSLRCGDNGGFSDPIRPDQAAVRLWPTTLPPGWRVTGIFATANASSEACRTPSLVAAAVDPGGTVTGRVWVTGPAQGIAVDGAAHGVDDVIDGRRAVRFLGSRPDTFTWLWSDRAGRQWSATVTGYPPARAKAVMAGVGTTGDQVSWRPGAAPDLRVLHQRTGPPYPRDTRTETWVVRLSDGHRQREIMVESNRSRPLASAAAVGMRIRSESGHTELLSGISAADLADIDRLSYEPAPGVWALAELHGDPADMRTVLTGLRDLPPGDPRLDKYAVKN